MAVDNFRTECFNIINIAKQNYLSNLGNHLNDPATRPEAYWKVLNKFLNKSNTPIIPPQFCIIINLSPALMRNQTFTSLQIKKTNRY